MNFYTTGQVAKKLNLSVRTLRYYDQIGLMCPSERGKNGTRKYNEDDLLTLEKITILKMLQLPLQDIEKILSTITTEQLLYAHRELLQRQMGEIQNSITYTNTLLNVIHLEGDLNWTQLFPLIQESKNKEKREAKWEEYFEQEEEKILKEKLPKMDDNSPEIKKWINIIRRTEICLEKGYSPHSEEAQIIAEDILLLSDELFAGNNELGDKFFEIRKSKEKSSELNLYPVDADVLQYIEEAIEIYTQMNKSMVGEDK